MLDTVEINHVQHISFAQSRLTDAVSVILSELLSYEHPSKGLGLFSIYAIRRANVSMIKPPENQRCEYSYYSASG